MREIKFNAWDIDRNIMITDAVRLENNVMVHRATIDESLNVIWLQYTGLKDKNFKEIWEDDIIEYTQHYFNTDMVETKRKIVKWEYDKWGVYETNAGESDVEVIGNIHDNPELLDK